MGIFEAIYYAFVAKTVMSAMSPQQTNNTQACSIPILLRECELLITLIFLPLRITPLATFLAKVKERASASSGLDIPLFFNASLDSSNIFP
jgi:hypothetical protein